MAADQFMAGFLHDVSGGHPLTIFAAIVNFGFVTGRSCDAAHVDDRNERF